jgi:hypothetical protein
LSGLNDEAGEYPPSLDGNIHTLGRVVKGTLGDKLSTKFLRHANQGNLMHRTGALVWGKVATPCPASDNNALHLALH